MMQMNRLLYGIYQLCKWITYFFYLNILWMLFSIIGGVVLGFWPSTTALYSLARKTALGEEDIPIMKTYWTVFKKEFIHANALGYLLLCMGTLVYFNLNFFRSFEGEFYFMMSFIMLLLALMLMIVTMYIFPVLVHYELKFLQYIKQAIFIAFLRPLHVASIFITGLATYYFFIYLPGFIPLFGISIFVHLNMWLAYQSFQSIEQMKVKMHIGEVGS